MNDAFAPEAWRSYLEEIVDLEARAQASELVVATLDDRAVGCVSYYPPGSGSRYEPHSFAVGWPDDWAAFRLLSVHPDARGRGIGRKLTEECINRARVEGASAVGLHTTAVMAAARTLYESMGFERAPNHDFYGGPGIQVDAYRLKL